MVISDAIAVANYNTAVSIFEDINGHYDQTNILFNSLSTSNEVVYDEDFTPVNTYESEWYLYQNVNGVGGNMNQLGTWINAHGTSTLENPSGYENNGYLVIPTPLNNPDTSSGLLVYNPDTSGVRLPYSSFQNSSAWQEGASLTIRIEFNASMTSGSSFPSNYKLTISNYWGSGVWNDTLDPSMSGVFLEEHPLTTASGSLNQDAFIFTFDVTRATTPDDFNRYCNISIIRQFNDNSDLNVHITSILINNNSETMLSFDNLQSTVSELNAFNAIESNISNVILEYNANQDEFNSIEEYLDSIGGSYNDFLSSLIPGFTQNATTIWTALQDFSSAVFDFNQSVQSQIYNQYQLYGGSVNATQADLDAMEATHQSQISGMQSQIDNYELMIEEYFTQFSYMLGNSGAFLTGPNIGATIINILAPDTSNYSSTNFFPIWPNDSFSENGVQMRVIFKEDGNQIDVHLFMFLSADELNSLENSPYSETNNVVHYLTNRFSNGQNIEFGIEGYPTQRITVLLANFNENSSVVGEDCPNLNITAGLDFANSVFTEVNNNIPLESPEDLYDIKGLQMIFYYDQSLEGNIMGSDDIHFSKVAPTSGNLFVNTDDYSIRPLSLNGSVYTEVDY